MCSQERHEVCKPCGLEWRSSVWFATLVVGGGVTMDLIVYSIVIPVLPFQLQKLGYSGVSSLVGWLLFAYSGGLAVFTPPIALFSERSGSRRLPLLLSMVFLIGSQIMLMLAPTFWLMCIARIIQGISSSVIWVVGLALLCDTSPETKVGQQLGIAMSGMSLGALAGPPIGGVLYNRFGFHAPFIFGIVFTSVDLIGRLLIIERKDALKWGFDPAAPNKHGLPVENAPQDGIGLSETGAVREQVQMQQPKPDGGARTEQSQPNDEEQIEPAAPRKHISLLGVMIQLSKSPRALTALFVTVVWGISVASQETTMPLHLQSVWGLDSRKVGLVMIASVVPTLFSSPGFGYLADHYGSEWVTAPALLMSVPWWVVLIIEASLTLFIAAFALDSFFTSGALAPLIAEMAAVARGHADMGYGHVYGAFNLAYGIGSAVGPLIGGQIYDHTNHGWMIVCLLGAGLAGTSSILAFAFTGENPLLPKMLRKQHLMTVARTTVSA